MLGAALPFSNSSVLILTELTLSNSLFSKQQSWKDTDLQLFSLDFPNSMVPI